MNATIETTCNGFIIALRDNNAFYKKVYFSGVRNGKNQFTMDYTHARTFKDIKNAEKKLTDILHDI